MSDAVRWRDSVRKAGHHLGVDIKRWRSPSSRLRSFVHDYSFENVVDVGANRGQFGLELRAAGFMGRIISFEPIRSAYRELESTTRADSRWECHRLALGDTSTKQPINISCNLASSSFLRLAPGSPAIKVGEQIAVEVVDVRRLDDIALELDLQGETLLKIDVQGYHLAVLRGAVTTLQRMGGVQCEVSVVPLYDGEAELLEVLSELERYGFGLVCLEPAYYNPSTGEILQFDARFVRLRKELVKCSGEVLG